MKARVDIICAWCGEPGTTEYRADASKRGRYCSTACAAKARGYNRRGKPRPPTECTTPLVTGYVGPGRCPPEVLEHINGPIPVMAQAGAGRMACARTIVQELEYMRWVQARLALLEPLGRARR